MSLGFVLEQGKVYQGNRRADSVLMGKQRQIVHEGNESISDRSTLSLLLQVFLKKMNNLGPNEFKSCVISDLFPSVLPGPGGV